MDHTHLHHRARTKGVNPIVYWVVRAAFQPFFHVYFRMARIGRHHIPRSGPVILASNHRSFLDPFIIGTLTRRPVYYVAKQELFRNRFVAWFLNSLGAFPVKRGSGDTEMIETAKAILARGDVVVIFVEGTRVRPGALGPPKRGVGRLALESGAPVVPVAIIGTEAVRRGWRIRPHKVRLRVGRPLTFQRVERPSPELAAGVTDRIWPCVMLQWEWLGGLAPLRRAAVIGAGAAGTGLASALARAGLQVELGHRGREDDEALPGARCAAPAADLPAGVTVRRAAELELSRHDLVCFAVPARDLPAAVAAHGDQLPPRAGVLVLADGMVPPFGTLPAAYVSERVPGWAVASLGAPAGALAAFEAGSPVVVATHNAVLRRQLTDVVRAAGLHAITAADVPGAELAGTAPPSKQPARAA